MYSGATKGKFTGIKEDLFLSVSHRNPNYLSTKAEMVMLSPWTVMILMYWFFCALTTDHLNSTDIQLFSDATRLRGTNELSGNRFSNLLSSLR